VLAGDGDAEVKKVQKISGTCVALILTCLLNIPLQSQSISELQTSNPLGDEKAAFLSSSTQSCSQSEKLVIPQAAATRAKLKARLVNLLRASLYDDAKGILNVAREKEIKKLAHKLTKEEAQ
jgi:hypothetical protein